MKFDVSAGRVRSEEPDAAAPGYGYVYWNAGLEGRLERLFCDLRYWDTMSKTSMNSGRRVVLTFGNGDQMSHAEVHIDKLRSSDRGGWLRHYVPALSIRLERSECPAP